MARRLLSLLILLCAAATAPASAAAGELHRHSGGADEPRTGKQALRQAKAALKGEGVDTGREVTPALRALAEKLPSLDGAERRAALRLLARPVQGEDNPNEATYDVPAAAVRSLEGPNFKVHYVDTVSAQGAKPAPAGACRNPADDRPPLDDANGNGRPDYVEQMLAEFEYVHSVENGTLGWAPAKADFGKGGNNKTDVYVKNIGPEGIFGYAAPDGDQPNGNQLAAYLVMDNDYCVQEFRNYENRPLDALRVTAAHEYNHVLQFNYDALQDNWMFESTAVWMEDEVYDSINDYVNYLPAWSKLSLAPLTRFDTSPREDNPNNAKAYGDVVFTRWVSARYGKDSIRRAWEQSIASKSFAPGAYDRALAPNGTNIYEAFSSFAADTAEWRLLNGPFEEGGDGAGFPEVVRAIKDPLPPQTVTKQRSDYVEGGIDHLSYGLFHVDPRGESEITVGATFRRGIRGAVALVGRTGDDRGGAMTVQLTRMPRGGVGRVTLPNASSYTRVTAVLINGHTGKSGYSKDIGDWLWTGDDEPITLAVNDFTKPQARRLSPKRDARRVSRRSAVKVLFSEGVAGVSTRNIRLLGPGNRRVRFALTQSRDGRTVRLKPMRKLAGGKRYTVKLNSSVTDGGGNRLPSSSRSWRFTTAR